MSDASVVCSHLSFSWPDDTPVFDDLSFALGAARTGLVAPNGAGKSTLLRLMAGQLRPRTGTVTVTGVLGYLPQDLPLTGEPTVAEVLGIAPVLRALAAIEAGDPGEGHFALIGDDWDVEERTRAQLDRLGLADVSLTQRLGSLSGGQIVSLGLAGQLLAGPDVLLLDEPTNNLDRDARRRLAGVLEGFTCCLLVVSHDRDLLDRMDQIAELDRGGIRLHGGNYTQYDATIHVERDAAERSVRHAEQELRREKRELQQARERAARRAGAAARNLGDAGLARIVAGGLKRSAQESAGRADQTHTARVDRARGRLDAAERTVRDEQLVAFDLPDPGLPAGRTVFACDGIQVHHGDRPVFAPGGVGLVIRGPERIALTGPNGAGKSTLLQVIAGELQPDGAAPTRSDGRVASLSQRLDLLDLDRTVAENLADFAPSMPPSQRRNLLARFLFRGSDVDLPVRVLSGGERLRATLACVLHAEPVPQLLLLDEPTNNLDLTSVGQLESALRAYSGALVVVSHDGRFLREIGVDRWLRLADGRLSETGRLGEG